MGQVHAWTTDLAQDLRCGSRTLRRSPVFTAVAVCTLGLVIGANAAVFSLLDPLILRDLPVRDPGNLVQFTWTYPGDPPLNIFSVDDYDRYRANNTVFSEMLGSASARVDAQSPQRDAVTLRIDCVTGNFFDVLGVRSATGRLLGEADNRPDAPAAAVVSWAYWNGPLNRAPEILGSTIVLLGDLSVTVVGVADRSFSGVAIGYTPDAWIPMGVCERKRRGGMALMARLKDGASIDRARAEMRVLDRPRIDAFARRDPQWRDVVVDVLPARAGLATPLHHQFVKPLSIVLALLAGLVLLACANIGGLLLVRGTARQQELAVRVSLGADRFRLARQLLTESLLLACAGGLVGILGAYLGARALVRIVASGTRSVGGPPVLDVTVDARVLVFTAIVVALATVVFGLLPALAAFPSAPAATLRESGSAGPPRSRRLFANGVVVAQVALAIALSSVSAALVDHLSSLRNRGLGFDRSSVLLIRLDPSDRANLPQRYRELLARLEAIPGVRAVTLSAMTPLSGGAASRFVAVDGFQEQPEARRRLLLNLVAPRYFATFGTPLLAGRDFDRADADSSRVAIVNQAMVRHYFAGRDPLGAHVRFDGDPQPYAIVGVVADAKYSDPRAPAPRTIYLHYFQQSPAPPEIALRTSVPPTSILGDVRRVADDVLGSVRLTKVATLAEQVDAAIVPERLLAAVSGFFGGVGLLLAAVGLFGLLAYTVARRTREIGVRMALGATERDVSLMVAKTALALVTAGLIVGAPVAWWGIRLAATVVGSLAVGSVLPVTVAAAATIALSLLAAYVPAHRATRVDPVVTLRSE